ncbi:hypothetical protein BKA70DRAFT_254162 [Coprinopsis sp. MPI-PUGE-AT-0042]|nr:hypothetical protein BKA70DRAFT_254162 [Coprinopsis sp. MPI-PUGE-AT-0042]
MVGRTQSDIVLLLRTSYAGILVMTFGQTYQLFLCLKAFRQARRTPRRLNKSRRPYVIVMFTILVLSAVSFIVDMLDKGALLTTGMAITPETVFPKDPLWWHIAAPLAIGGTHIAGDGLLVWRTRILWKTRSYIWALPIIPYIGSFGLLIAYTAISSKWALTEEESGVLLVIRIQTAYFISSVSVSLVATTLICIRLLTFKRKVEKAMGGREVQSQVPYLRIVGILVESALPFTIFGIACAVSSSLFAHLEETTPTNAAYHIVWPLWVISSALAPQLIIARVLNGSSWSHDPTQQVEDMATTLEFSAAPNPSRSNPDFVHSSPQLSNASSTLSPTWKL